MRNSFVILMMKYVLPGVLLFLAHSAVAQMQACPLNNNFSFGNLTHWEAYTGNNADGNGPSAIKMVYDSSQGPPSGTNGTRIIYEYQLPSVPGIQILSLPSKDPFGNFTTVPKINGYQYTNSIVLGSTSITRSSAGGAGGGYVRGVSYRFNVPPGPVTEPYTMTYAYAMVLENGTHPSNEQPLFEATLMTSDSVITCASPKYFLPTFSNPDPRQPSTLDSGAAIAEGFKLSSKLSPNENPNGVGAGATQHLQDVWYKSWTEVTFDLGPYRGQQVVLTFETDNCVPGGHFAYSYVALRNTCGGLVISGDTVACLGSTLTYSVPGLSSATYNWSVPNGWNVVSGQDSSVLQVQVGNAVGTIAVDEQNSCTNLKAALPVTTSLPTIAGALAGGTEVCSGTNNVQLTLAGNRGSVLNWLASTDGGITYTPVADTNDTYTAQNLTNTTIYRALVQDGESCSIDTSTATTVVVDPLTVGGALSPANMLFCLGQTKDALLKLTGEVGLAVNWQSSPDGVNWTDFNPVNADSVYEVSAGLTTPEQYRVIVQSGVCPPMNSAPAVVSIVQTPFPEATSEPADTIICYGTQATLNADIELGTSYTWTNANTLNNQGDGNIASVPDILQPTASPLSTGNYVLSIVNAGCPNALKDTFHVRVLPPILVNPGDDTSVVIGQPLQLQAASNDTTTPGGDKFTWVPSIGLNNANISDPVAVLSGETDSIRYFVTATSMYGCTGVASILVKVFKTGPDIFVPNAFTPGGGTNKLFRPIPVGITSLQFFRVYNRWGQLVYSTVTIGDGWDGMLDGKPLPSDTYVWQVEGTTYEGRRVFHKGTMVLVR